MLESIRKNEEIDNASNFNLIVGITIAISTSFIQSLGLTIQKKSHILNEKIHPKELRRSACRRPLWHLGFETYIISNVTGSIFSVSYLPIIILAPLGAVNLVFNAIFAKLLLGDIFNKQTIIGTILITIGAVMIAIFGVVKEPHHSLEDLIELYKRPLFIAYFSVIEFVVITILIANKFGEYLLDRMNRNERDPIFGWPMKKFQTALGISYGCVSGMLSSQGLIFAKSGIELLFTSVSYHENQFNRPLSWFIVVGMAIASLSQLYYLNKGLKLCDTVILVPLSFCTFNASTIFNGLVYYNQWGRLHGWQIFLVILGICILLSGVLVLSWRRGVPEKALLAGEDRMLLGRDVEGLTENYENEENFDMYDGYGENMDNARYSLEGDSSNTGMLSFEEMIQEDDDADEKTSLLGNNRIIHDNYGI